MTSRRAAFWSSVLAAAGLGIALYLTVVRLLGDLPACGPIRGCEDVALSPYSVLFGIPVAAFGAAMSAALLAVDVWWWRSLDRRAPLVAYGIGLAGVVVIAYLTYLEVAVIGAVCVWCAAYALTVVAGWIVAARSVRQARRSVAPDQDV
jgi:uncharacterized membrane protein